MRKLIYHFSSISMIRWRFAAILFTVALTVRVAADLSLRNIHRFHGMQGGADAVEYNQLGLHVAARLCYCVNPGHLSAFRAPGFPFFMAALYSVSYENYPLAYLSLCAVGALACVLTYFAAAELMSEDQARVAGVLMAFYFPHIYSSTWFMSECLFSLLMAAALFLLLKNLKGSSPLTTLGLGAVLGYAALTRPVALLMWPLTMLLLVWKYRRHWPHALAPMLLLTIAWAAMIVPWSLRNYHVFGKPVLIATNGGSTFYGANNDIVMHDRHFLGSWVPTNWLPHRDWIVAAPDEVTHDAREYQLGQQWVRDHLSEMPLLEYYKIARLFLPDLTSPNKTYRILQTAGYLPVMVLTIFGIAQTFRRPYRSIRWAAVHSLIAMTVVSALIYYGSDRFRDAVTPALVIYAALALTALWGRLTREEPLRPQRVAAMTE